jgi:hypothetical protein
MILNIKEMKNFTKKIQDIINNISKVSGYKINLQKSVAFLYVSNEQNEKEYRKTIPFTTLSKISRNHLNIGSERYLYENYKPLKNEIEDTTEHGNISHVHALAESIL